MTCPAWEAAEGVWQIPEPTCYHGREGSVSLVSWNTAQQSRRERVWFLLILITSSLRADSKSNNILPFKGSLHVDEHLAPSELAKLRSQIPGFLFPVI